MKKIGQGGGRNEEKKGTHVHPLSDGLVAFRGDGSESDRETVEPEDRKSSIVL